MNWGHMACFSRQHILGTPTIKFQKALVNKGIQTIPRILTRWSWLKNKRFARYRFVIMTSQLVVILSSLDFVCNEAEKEMLKNRFYTRPQVFSVSDEDNGRQQDVFNGHTRKLCGQLLAAIGDKLDLIYKKWHGILWRSIFKELSKNGVQYIQLKNHTNLRLP